MNKLWMVAVLVGGLLSSPAGAQTLFRASLTPDAQTHDVTSSASGTAAVVLMNDEIEFAVTVDGLSGPIAAAHFHRGPMGENGGVVRTITGEFSGGTASGTWRATDSEPLTADLIDALFAGELYVNVHTAANPAGEIRGQVLLAAATVLTGDLTAAQAGTASAGSGTATVLLSENEVVFHLTVDGLSGPITAAHFHRGTAGTNGGVVRTISGEFSGNRAFGVWTSDDAEPLSPELVEDLVTGGLYLNIHTAANPPGEIRGQIERKSGWAFGGSLDAAQETHSVTSDARGAIVTTLTSSGLAFYITVEGLSGTITAAHFHNAATGADGPPVRTITADFDGNTARGLWSFEDAEPLTGELIGELFAGRIYVNVHTAANQSGEIRSQLELAEGVPFSAALRPTQESVVATGTAVLQLTGAGLEYDLSVDGLSGPIVAAHFHKGAEGNSGLVVQTITGNFTGNTASGIWTATDAEPLTAELVSELMKGNLYFNLHTAAHPGGEVRGQIYLAGGTGLYATLTPAQQTHDVTSAAVGSASLVMTPAGVAYSVTTTGLSGPASAAHFHMGAEGTNGGVVRTITDDFSGSTAVGFWALGDAEPLSESLATELLRGRLYLNVHTAANPPGEIRGQILPVGEVGLVARLDADQEVHDVTSGAHGTSTVMLAPAGAMFRLTVEGLSGAFSAAHFHNAPRGTNGGVVRTITGDFVGNTAAGVWKPSDAEPLTSELIVATASEEVYLNVHTAANPPGEIRGQVEQPPNFEVVTIERVGGPDEIPTSFGITSNYPNPFNPSTTITFLLDTGGDVTLDVFDVLGRRVRTLVDERLVAGEYRVDFDADGLPSGTYVTVLSSQSQRQSRPVVLLR